MNIRFKTQKKTIARKGFSLTELLTVIFVMVLMLGIGGLTLAKNDSGRQLTMATTTMQSMIDLARSTAINEGVMTRLIINNGGAAAVAAGPAGSAGIDLHLRQLMIIKDSTPTAAAYTWAQSGRTKTLSQGTLLNPAKSVAGVVGVGGVGLDAAGFAFPRSAAATDSYYYIQFNPLGICTLDDKSTVVGGVAGSVPGSGFVLSQGAYQNAIVITKGNNEQAIIVLRNGSVVPTYDAALIAAIPL